jgi:phosphoribosylamine--glycine ligase
LYAGLMIDAAGSAKVVEFNCRLGDPETQPILFRLRSDLVRLCLSSFDGTLGLTPIDWDPRATVGVVIASRGYPDAYEKGKRITGLESITGQDQKIFHAGTRLVNGEVVTDGGRVLCAVGIGDTVGAAQRRAYDAASKITWGGAFCRKDIGYRAVERERAGSARR